MTFEEAVRYCDKIRKQYNLTVNPKFEKNYRKTRVLGYANYGRMVIGLCYNHLKNGSLQSIKNTLRHELAHLQAHTEGSHGHDGIFKRWAMTMQVEETCFTYPNYLKTRKGTKRMFYLINRDTGEVVDKNEIKSRLRKKWKQMVNKEQYKVSRFSTAKESNETEPEKRTRRKLHIQTQMPEKYYAR